MSKSVPFIQAWKAVTQRKGFERLLQKVNILSAENGSCTAEMTVLEEHMNVSGTLHGGMTCTIVDVVSGFALATHEKNPNVGVSVDIHVSFLRGIAVGEEILIEAKTKKAGRTLAFLDVLIKDKKSGDIVASGSHTKFVAT